MGPGLGCHGTSRRPDRQPDRYPLKRHIACARVSRFQTAHGTPVHRLHAHGRLVPPSPADAHIEGVTAPCDDQGFGGPGAMSVRSTVARMPSRVAGCLRDSMGRSMPRCSRSADGSIRGYLRVRTASLEADRARNQRKANAATRPSVGPPKLSPGNRTAGRNHAGRHTRISSAPRSSAASGVRPQRRRMRRAPCRARRPDD